VKIIVFPVDEIVIFIYPSLLLLLAFDNKISVYYNIHNIDIPKNSLYYSIYKTVTIPIVLKVTSGGNYENNINLSKAWRNRLECFWKIPRL